VCSSDLCMLGEKSMSAPCFRRALRYADSFMMCSPYYADMGYRVSPPGGSLGIPLLMNFMQHPDGPDGHLFCHNRTFHKSLADTLLRVDHFIHQLIFTGRFQNFGFSIFIMKNGLLCFPVIRQFDITFFSINISGVNC